MVQNKQLEYKKSNKSARRAEHENKKKNKIT